MTSRAQAPAPIAVIGLGNVLLGDDGCGPFVIEQLRAAWQLPATVELIDAGTPGLDLVTYLDGREVVIFIDAVVAAGSPGDVRIYGGDDLRGLPAKPRGSPHDPAVQEALDIVALAGRGPRQVLLVGIIAETLALGAGLSPVVYAATERAVGCVVEALRQCGAPPLPRQAAPLAVPWWLRAACASRPHG